MFSSEIDSVYIHEGTLQIFVEPFAQLSFDEDFFINISKIEFISPGANSLVLLHLVGDELFVLNTNLSSNSNLAIRADSILEISANTTIEASQIFITNYPIDEKNLRESAIPFDGTSETQPIINRGNIVAKQIPSALATSKLENHGYISNEIDCKNLIGLDQKTAKTKV